MDIYVTENGTVYFSTNENQLDDTIILSTSISGYEDQVVPTNLQAALTDNLRVEYYQAYLKYVIQALRYDSISIVCPYPYQ